MRLHARHAGPARCGNSARPDGGFDEAVGSWLNMAETELSVLSGQCLDRRMDSKEMVIAEVTPWEAHRNQTEAKVRWRFTTEKARIKLGLRHPVGHPEQPRP